MVSVITDHWSTKVLELGYILYFVFNILYWSTKSVDFNHHWSLILSNGYVGPIPPQLSALTNLTILRLFNNQLNGNCDHWSTKLLELGCILYFICCIDQQKVCILMITDRLSNRMYM